MPDGEKVGRLKDSAERNLLGLVLGGVAVGLMAGLLLPSTRIEDERMGEISDRVVDAAKETATDALESSKQVVRDAAGSAMEEGGELASNLQDRTQEAVTGTPEAPAGAQPASSSVR